MNKFLLVVFTLLFMPLSQLSAQLVGGDAFLKGTYVEVGINNCGAYGSGDNPPGGYHPNPTFALGFVADSDQDGWDIGSPDYCGDYFVPGSPVEGWQIQIGSSVYTNTDQSCWTSEIPGEVTGYSYGSGIYTGVWEGEISSHDLGITQTTTLPEDALYFVTRILLCNNGTDTIEDVYYMRNVDPDQDQPWSGDFTTDNEVIYQPPTDPDALVISEGLTYGCFLGLGAKDPNARVSYGNFSTTDGTPEEVWEGTGGYYSSGSLNGDIANSISIYVDKILPGECRCIAFAYILNIDDLDEALDATLSSIGATADGADISTSGTTYICPGDTTQLAILNGEDYEWTWTPIDGLNSNNNDTVYASPEVTTTYTIVGNGICGEVERELTVVVWEPPVASAGIDTGVCHEESITLDGSGGETYLWQPPVYLDDETSENPTVESPLTDMYYYLEVTDINGCKDTDMVYVELYPIPDVDAGSDKVMALNTFTQLYASGAETYEWTPAETLSDGFVYNPYAYPDDTIMYYVTGTDENGCTHTDSVTVFVIDPVFIVSPNIFTPNFDNINDKYIPSVEGLGELIDFQIYSRWGAMVYDWNVGDLHGWDGTYEGKIQEVGTYIVLITARDVIKNVELQKTVNVILMK
ncbi:MAG: gliding motility-associated C-terminal domain-containing protein [Fimbriimonadaceae bacterium]|nr:gliding motility-associated C-terminal domain-containing protein [Chitinophagales bacterium]